MNTRIFKGRDGWEAETKIDLDDGRSAKITTCKRHNGKVETFVTVGVSGSDCGFTTFTHAIFSDFCKCFAAEKIRCTDKIVTAQHQFVLESWETIKADIAAFYKDKPLAA